MLTMSIILVGFLTMGIISIFVDNEDTSDFLKYFGFVPSVIIILIYFGLYATISTDYSEYERIIPTSITKSETTVFVEFDKFSTKEYTEHTDYLKIDSTSIFLVVKNYNHYGSMEYNYVVYYSDKEEANKLINNKK